MNPVDTAAQRHPWATRHVGDKMALCGGLLLLVVSLPAWPTALLVGVIAVVLVLRTGTDRRLYRLMVLGPVGFVLVGIFPLLITLTPQGVMWVSDGPAHAATVVARSAAGIAITMVFALSTPLSEIIAAAGRARLPETVLFVVVAVYRMTSVLIITATSMYQAQDLRLGHRTRRALVRSTAGAAANLLVQAFARATAIGAALSLRAEPGSMKVYLPARPHDSAFLLRSAGTVLAVAALGSAPLWWPL